MHDFPPLSPSSSLSSSTLSLPSTSHLHPSGSNPLASSNSSLDAVAVAHALPSQLQLTPANEQLMMAFTMIMEQQADRLEAQLSHKFQAHMKEEMKQMKTDILKEVRAENANAHRMLQQQMERSGGVFHSLCTPKVLPDADNISVKAVHQD